jgi:hypothetical protein
MAQTRKSIDRPIDGKCPTGYHPRKGYTIKKTGTRVADSCVRATTFGPPRKNFVRDTRRRMSQRLQGISQSRRGIKPCPRGKILRSPYVRIRKDKRVFIPASCINDVGNPGKGFVSPSGSTGIGPLRKGDLARFGYKTVTAMSEERRHLALRSAVQEYGSLTVWRKLNAIYIYTRHTSPESSAIFLEDRDWVRNTFGISAI